MSHLKHLLKKTHETLQSFTSKVAALKHRKELQETEIKHSAPEKPVYKKIELVVSAGTIAKFVSITLILLLAAAFLYKISDILVIFFVSLLFAAALDPMVDGLERRKIPRALGVIIIYLVVLTGLGILISTLVPVVATELAQLAGKAQDFISNIVKGELTLPSFLERFRPAIKSLFEGIDMSKFIGDYKDFLIQAAKQLSDVAGNVVNAAIAVFNGFFNMLLVLVITFLMVIDEQSIDKFILSLFPARHAEYIRHKSNAIKEKMGYWLRGQITLCVIVGVMVYLGFLLIGVFSKPVEYAATISLVAGFTELIPYAGPFLAWIIALPIVANQSVSLILWMTVLLYIVQVLENNVIVPVVMQRAVGISPIFVMFSMMVGFTFLGVLGMVLAVPVATGVSLFVKDYADKDK